MNPMVDWQTAYLQQLQRTTGQVGTITRSGSWYVLDTGNPHVIPSKHRKAEIMGMTERLKGRCDWNKRK